ncbi:2-hydroxychromene-2-carboxylate isomerase [Devosia subaequoris]|uniref:2-hydroxychromene-2-carboxylate isomerase n=1 Tax=Devosia subaequoris TaxID=395930 RepID=A0A7W6IIX5_9HYPH|nr:2-hydroxychromene-2-carboxylate isomerase [Devosia subaequoris]MCP1208824.1 DUF3572 domain-containing protein [Devosia subaequoris]
MPATDRSALNISALADMCLGYLAENPEELLGFMQHAGLTPDALRAAIGSDRLQHGLIDYFASNEPILLALCANSGITPEQFMRVWYRLNRVE